VLKGEHSGMLLSYRGRTLYHGDRGELEFLFPRSQVVQVTGRVLAAACAPLEPMPIKDHPGMAPVTWPLNREDFR
jgi:hypothetical protein